MLEKKKERQGLPSFFFFFLSSAFGMELFCLNSQELPDSSVIPRLEKKKKKKRGGHLKVKWENYEIAGSIEIGLSGLRLWI